MFTLARSSLTRSSHWQILLYLGVVPFALALGYVSQGMFSLETERPYIYRQFVPLLAGLIQWLTGGELSQAFMSVITLCSIGFAVASYQLHRSFHGDGPRATSFVLGNLLVLFLIISFPKHTYDVPTAMFFTLVLVLFARGHLTAYALLFPLICLNRETAILLTLLFAVYFFRRLERRTYLGLLVFQVLVYVSIRLALMWIFADTPGSALWIRPLENWQMYFQDPPSTILFLLVVGLVVYLARDHWARTPELARAAFLVFAPLLALLYVVSGVSFEIRVFVELLPVVMVIVAS